MFWPVTALSTRNNQRSGVRHATEYEIDRWTPESLSGVVCAELSGHTDLKLVA